MFVGLVKLKIYRLLDYNPSIRHYLVRKNSFIYYSNVLYLFLGYTDGTCPFDNKRYFHCPNGQGYYILESGLNDSYEIIKANRVHSSDDEFHSPE